jgi:hypothetical protein
VLVLDAAGHVRVHADPLIGPADPASPSARQAPSPRPARPPAPGGRARTAAARRSVPPALDALLRAGAIDLPTRDIWLAGFTGAKRTAARLRGTRSAQLAAVIDNVRELAADGLLSGSRAPLAFLTLARNRAWWANAPLLGYGQRVGFDGSELVWQYYPGQGIEVQWLGTFGKANGLVKQRTRPDRLRALLDEALALAAARAGGIAWEGLFGFGGGRPPWASALTQGTAVQALTRAAAQLAEPRYLEGARAALGLFETRPPQGVRVATPAGAHYLQYSFAPRPASRHRSSTPAPGRSTAGPAASRTSATTRCCATSCARSASASRRRRWPRRAARPRATRRPSTARSPTASPPTSHAPRRSC